MKQADCLYIVDLHNKLVNTTGCLDKHKQFHKISKCRQIDTITYIIFKQNTKFNLSNFPESKHKNIPRALKFHL